MQHNVHFPKNKHDHVDKEVCAAGLQGFTVQRLAVTGQTDNSDPAVGDNDAADGGCQEEHSEGQTVDVIDNHTLTGQLEQ